MNDILEFINENFEEFCDHLMARGVKEEDVEECAERQVKELEEAINS